MHVYAVSFNQRKTRRFTIHLFHSIRAGNIHGRLSVLVLQEQIDARLPKQQPDNGVEPGSCGKMQRRVLRLDRLHVQVGRSVQLAQNHLAQKAA